MNWKQATMSQLLEIYHNDTGAKLEHKLAAQAEIQRRRKRQHNKVQYRENVKA
jgi:hypothetical protein